MWSFPIGAVVKNLPANAGDMKDGFDPWVGKMPWRRECYPLQYSCLESSMDRGAWQATVHRVTKTEHAFPSLFRNKKNHLWNNQKNPKILWIKGGISCSQTLGKISAVYGQALGLCLCCPLPSLLPADSCWTFRFQLGSQFLPPRSRGAWPLPLFLSPLCSHGALFTPVMALCFWLLLVHLFTTTTPPNWTLPKIWSHTL